MAVPVHLGWSACADPDGDPVIYDVKLDSSSGDLICLQSGLDFYVLLR